jgi:hypothetical protein
MPWSPFGSIHLTFSDRYLTLVAKGSQMPCEAFLLSAYRLGGVFYKKALWRQM